MAEATQRGSTARARVAFWFALALGFVGRAAYLADKPLWRDEAWVALLVGQPFAALRQSRPVPAGFVLLTDAAAALPHLSLEVKLRLVPLLCGLALLPALARLATALGADALTAVAAMSLAAGLTPLIYYSRELKPYGIDAFLAVLIPLLAVRGFDRAADKTAHRALVAAVIVAPWVSFAALFSVVAVLMWGWLVWWPQADRAARRDWVVTTLAFAASFAASYVLIVGEQSTDPGIHGYWEPLLAAERGLSVPRRLLVAARSFAAVSPRYFFPGAWPLFVPIAAVGALAWPRPQRAFLIWLYGASAALAVIAAAFDRYVLLHGRFVLFSAPVLLLWFANGLTTAARWARVRAASELALVVCAVLATYWTTDAIRHRIQDVPTVHFRYDVLQDMDDMIAQTVATIADGDPVLISHYGGDAFPLYARNRLPQARYCEAGSRDFASMTRDWLGAIRDRGWMIITDEESSGLGPWVDDQGFAHVTRRRARGLALWEVTPASHAPTVEDRHR